MLLQERYNLSAPVHTLYGHQSWSHKTRTMEKHFIKSPHELDSTIRLSTGLRLSSPEMLFLQMASELDFANLVELGFELCGTYSLPANGSDAGTQYNLEPLTSSSLIRRYLEKSCSRKGVGKARAAAKFIRDNSYSPMETKAALLLGLPCCRGGAGLSLPTMNYPVKLDRSSRVITGKRQCYCDMMWIERKVDVEYDSSQEHQGKEKLRADSVRREALKHMGIEVMTLTDLQLYNAERFDVFARDLAALLGKRIAPRCKDYPAKKLQLRKSLLG